MIEFMFSLFFFVVHRLCWVSFFRIIHWFLINLFTPTYFVDTKRDCNHFSLFMFLFHFINCIVFACIVSSLQSIFEHSTLERTSFIPIINALFKCESLNCCCLNWWVCLLWIYFVLVFPFFLLPQCTWWRTDWGLMFMTCMHQQSAVNDRPFVKTLSWTTIVAFAIIVIYNKDNRFSSLQHAIEAWNKDSNFDNHQPLNICFGSLFDRFHDRMMNSLRIVYSEFDNGIELAIKYRSNDSLKWNRKKIYRKIFSIDVEWWCYGAFESRIFAHSCESLNWLHIWKRIQIKW